jgi:hypothetical protein
MVPILGSNVIVLLGSLLPAALIAMMAARKEPALLSLLLITVAFIAHREQGKRAKRRIRFFSSLAIGKLRG